MADEERRKPSLPDGELEAKLRKLIIKAHKDWKADPQRYSSYYTHRLCWGAPLLAGRVESYKISPNRPSDPQSPMVTTVNLHEELEGVYIMDELGNEDPDEIVGNAGYILVDGAVKFEKGQYVIYNPPGNLDLVRVYDPNLNFVMELHPGKANEDFWKRYREEEKYSHPRNDLSKCSPQWGGYD
jgi:hypothetical protein